jgi:hypothetical protein
VALEDGVSARRPELGLNGECHVVIDLIGRPDIARFDRLGG